VSIQPARPATLAIQGLTVAIPRRDGSITPVRDVSFEVQAGEVFGIVGESGAGKSTVGAAITRLLDFPARIAAGSIRLNGDELADCPDRAMCRIRGRRIGTVLQDPLTSLNPVLSVGRQLMGAIRLHSGTGRTAARARAADLLAQVGIPEPERRLDQFPHQLSGGLRQRVAIAIAVSAQPELVIADEPTTALDVRVQSELLKLIRTLCRAHRTAVILITHDLAVINEVADRVAVMRDGHIVECGWTRDILSSPAHEYTRLLLNAVPRADRTVGRFDLAEAPRRKATAGGRHGPPLAWFRVRAATGASDAIIEVSNLTKRYPLRGARRRDNNRQQTAVENVSFSIRAGEALGLVGESGSGKTTLARLLCGLEAPDEGSIRYGNLEISRLSHDRTLRARCLDMQMLFQDPFSSLNPRLRIGEQLSEPVRVHRLAERSRIDGVVREILESVDMPRDAGSKLPHQFSGGERQRICLARSLMMRPRFLICDEPTSSLDVVIQAHILNLLKDLQARFELTILFISHDLAVVRQMCDRVAVMKGGRLCEIAEVNALFDSPRHAYTRELIEHIPRLDRSLPLEPRVE
jgi:peptide/nickel transport system ATP-binding protein